ncbi:gliding motility protein GldM [Apibacter sp.]|uniref:type IX secretion system motor protein PorM/GldM n=1 Tax=Apibacter sp. TaxID=2023709 RepID=UPI0025E5F2C6|nr:gliding motility protein GldM [Apibacter sp.]MCT6868910.1 gliding motility protein GldM [Apibacter sp.]
MAAGKQTPRQKMINLMYLVFISMLAMNVDREILRSFEGINESLQLSTKLTDENNKTFYEQIEAKKAEGKEGYEEIAKKSDEVKNQAKEAIDAIQNVKKNLTEIADYRPPSAGEETNYNSLQNTDVVNKVFFVNDNTPTKEVQEMITKVQNFTKFILQGAGENAKMRIEQLFDFSDKQNKPWVVNQFYDQPMISALTNLTRLESNIRTEEGNRVRDLLANKLEDEIELKAFVPIVSAPKFVRAGEKFNVVIGFGAYDNTLKGSITLNGRNIPLSGGKAVVNMVASGIGKQSLSGNISYQTPGGIKTEKFNETYEVVQDVVKDLPTGGTVVADKMNVVYRGVDNPMSGSVTGVDASTISMTTSNGSLSKSGKGWIYKAGSGTTTSFTISGKTSSGKTVSTTVGFRIKNVPKAQGTIRGANVVSMPGSSVPNQTVSAAIPDFEFPVTFNVTGFKLKRPGAAARPYSGNSLRAAADYLKGLKSGDQVLIFDIAATASGISQQSISPILINVQ